MSAQTDKYVRKLLQLCVNNNIEVYWIAMPIMHRVKEAREELDFERKYNSYLESLNQKYGSKFHNKVFLVL